MPNHGGPTSAREDYLKGIYHLGGAQARVQTSALAGHLGVRKPSVTSMVKRLATEGLVDHSPRKGVTLTPAGLQATMRVVRRHRLLETFLVEVLGLDWSEVHQEAEVLEHHLSDRVLDAIDHLLGHPPQDPHGHMIPDAEHQLPVRELTPLGELAPGTQGTVREVHADRGARLRRWKELGIVPGARLRLVGRRELDDVLELEVAGRAVVSGSAGVDGVLVEVDA